MPNDHLVLCGPAKLTSRKKEWREARTHRLQIGTGKEHVHLKIEHITRKMAAQLPAAAIDLVEIAAYVYSADQVVTRGGTKEFEYGQKWRRNFRFEIPVRCPELWNHPEIQQRLAEVLGFLSDDDYEFHFSRYAKPPRLDRYLFDQSDDEADFEEVILFSGGLDSFGGAVQEIVQGQRKIVLVSHRPVSKLYSRQRDLVRDLTERISNQRISPLHVAVEVNKGKDLGREFTQRSRSFLFAALGAVISKSLNLNRIRFYENGVISLNMPISPQVIGGRATRTTHPQVIGGLEALFSSVFEEPFSVENPYLWKTKAEVLKEIKAAGYGQMCAHTSSCTHTLAMTTMHSHCGRCSQCIDRRLNALAAGFDDSEDPNEMYESDVLLGEREGEEFTLVERYVGTAREVDRMGSAVEFVTRFGEAARVLRHVGMPARDAAERLFDLYKRHARDICRALSQVNIQNSDLVISTDYPVNSLLAVAVGRGQAVPVSPPANDTDGDGAAATAGSGKHRKPVVDKDTFTVEFNGRRCELRNTKEFWLFERLNRRPGQYFSNDVLIHDVWNDEHTEKNTIQRTMSNLRRKLRDAEFEGIEIDGTSNRGHYALKLPGR